MKVTDFVQRLSGSRETGQGRWIARCPAHEDRSPSLSIRQSDSGAILIHCFAGCDVHAVVTAAGITVSDLFPDRPSVHPTHRQRREFFDARDVLACLAHELMVGIAIMRDVEAEQPLTLENRARFSLACRRIVSAAELAGAS